MTAGEIADRFGCTWPTTSRHLRVLQEAGLVRVEKQGRERVYTLDRKKLREIAVGWLTCFDAKRREKP
jgi:DNA-binding transcriptional ArsR family regulator